MARFIGHEGELKTRYNMDISVFATIGFTTAAVIGIIALVFSAGKGKPAPKPGKRV
jgi:hypothetical protein